MRIDLGSPTLNEAFEELRADYDLSKSTRFRRSRAGVNSVGKHADYHYRSEAQFFRAMELSRDIDRNDIVVGQAVERLVDNVIQGGFTLWLPGKVHGMEQMLVVRAADPSRVNRENIHRRDMLPGPKSQVILVAKKDESIGHIHHNDYRGVTTVLMENPYLLRVFMFAAVFANIDDDPVEL